MNGITLSDESRRELKLSVRRRFTVLAAALSLIVFAAGSVAVFVVMRRNGHGTADFFPAGFPTLILFMLLAFALLALLIGFLCSRLIFRPLEQLSDSVERLRGDATERVHGLERGDEFGHLANVIDHMKDRISGIQYAARIQKNMLPNGALFREAFRDYSILWKPKDSVGGDIYWIRNYRAYRAGAVLCVCDCTGHGTSGALLSMLTVSALESIVNEGNAADPAQIVWELEQRFLATVNSDTDAVEDAAFAADGSPLPRRRRRRRENAIPDGCDLAVLYIDQSGAVSFASGNMNILSCDGEKVTRHRGQRMHVGAGMLARKEEIETTHLPALPGRTLCIATDGLYEQPGGEKDIPPGFEMFENILLENHAERQSVVSGKIWDAFEAYRGGSPRCDDVSVITVKL